MKTILVDAVNTFVVAGNVNKALFALLETYPTKKIILTNANDEQMVTFNLTNLPYEVFTLKHEPNKDNPEYYHTFLKKYALTPKEVVYFEHNEDAVASAKSVGITTYYYNPKNDNLVELKLFLDENV